MYDEFGQEIPKELEKKYSFQRSIIELGISLHLSASKIAHLLRSAELESEDHSEEPPTRNGFRRRKGEHRQSDKGWEKTI